MKRSGDYASLLVADAQRETDATGVDFARAQVTCHAPNCGRHFIGIPSLRDHAEAVHTFDDIRRMVSEVCREKYGRQGDYEATPVIPSIYVWVDDLATDWVVFMVEEGNDSKLLKASYSIVDGAVTLGEPVEVRRRTVYDAVKSDD